MVKIGQTYIYKGKDLNFRNMKCIVHGRNEKGFKVTFFDEFLGKIDTTVKSKDLQMFI